MGRRVAVALTGRRVVVAVLAAGAVAACAQPAPAHATDLAKPICSLAGWVSTLASKACSAASHAGNLLTAGKKLLGGHLGGAVETLAGSAVATKAVGLAAAFAWVVAGAAYALHETATLISWTTRPQLQSTWFSAYYWRMAAIAALLTLPFLCAASIQAVMRSDGALLARSALVYLPLGMLAISVAAPVTALLLSATDELASLIASAGGGADTAILGHIGFVAGLISVGSGSAFFALFVALLTVAATVVLWLELLIRSAAVYVIVLMLPLFFAALVWPARRVWAARALEVLVALVLSKFAIVAVLSLGGAALGHTAIPGVASELQGAALISLAAFSPWALLRLLPLHDLAAGLEGMRARPQQPVSASIVRAGDATEIARDLVRQLPPAAQIGPDPAPDDPRPAEAAVPPPTPDIAAEPPPEPAAPAAPTKPPYRMPSNDTLHLHPDAVESWGEGAQE